jgi:hypothetical protein
VVLPLDGMASLTFLHPLDQPFDPTADRAIDWLRKALASKKYTSLRLAVAYAKEGALLRLRGEIDGFRKAGGTIDAVIGLDQRVTSRQALRFALAHFSGVRVWKHPSLSLTFHPKLYLFEGSSEAEIHVGSCNLTVGGLEGNCESAVLVRYALPAENAEWAIASAGWTALAKHPNGRKLDAALLADLEANDIVSDEAKTGGLRQSTTPAATSAVRTHFPSTTHRGASPLPAPPRKTKAPAPSPPAAPIPVATASPISASIPQSLLIQIVPHDNGEVFLSKRAVDQQHAFFGYPWTGVTTPKKSGNTPYEQRVPDPIMDWTVFDKSGRAKITRRMGINTVFYTRKAEIRITITSDLREAIESFSILQMERADLVTTGVDYVCEVYPPGSPQFVALLSSCNQTMPSGGAAQARKFGWV